MSDEQLQWAQMIADLQALGVTLEKIAEQLDVTVRQVSNWKTGDRPLGMKAVRLYLLHARRCVAIVPRET